MECDICTRTDFGKIGLHCTVCARTAIYPLRIDAARTLLEKASLGRKVEHTTSQNLPTGATDEDREISRAWRLESRRTYLQNVKVALEAKREDRHLLQTEIQKMKEELARKQDTMGQKRKDLDLIRKRIPSRQHDLIDKYNQVGRRGLRSFDLNHIGSVGTRAFLCREAATLLRLKVQKINQDKRVRQYFMIAGYVIPNLRYIHKQRCEDLTAVLAAVSRLLLLISFYLGVRLPAEITLPHRDYPLTTISPPSASYLAVKTPFPGSGSGVSLSSSPASSKYEGKSVSKPRPLFIGRAEETLVEAAKQDPVAYNYFLEALSLLAWNLTWLKHSQGISSGSGSWDAACDIGRNLWQLLYAPQESNQITRLPPNRDFHNLEVGGKTESPATPSNLKATTGSLGEHSHASAHTFLGYSTGKDQPQPMKLSKHTLIFDPLRKALEIEFKNAEWDLLDRAEAEDGEERFNTKEKGGNAIVVKDVDLGGRRYDEARRIADAQHPNIPGNAANGIRAKGTSGWTKIRTREDAP